MIKFFRRIRRNLLNEGKTGKYLKYAIGEILLIVIGIFIALQFNNWNELKKQRKLQDEILSEIKSDLIENSTVIENTILQHKDYLKLGQNLVDHLKNRQPETDSITYAYTQIGLDFDMTLKNSGFANLNSFGLNLVENDELRKVITNLYQLEIPQILTEYDELDIEVMAEINHFDYLELDLTKIRISTFKYADTLKWNKWKLINYPTLLDDLDYLRISQQMLFMRSKKIDLLYKLNAIISRVTEKITVELNS